MIDPAIRGAGPEPAASRPETTLLRGEAEGKRDDFRKAMQEDAGQDRPEEESAPAGRGKSAEKGEEPLPPPLSGDALLRGLGSSYAPLEAAPAVPAAQDAPDLLAAEMAERILVNADPRAEGGEVRIVLKDSVLLDAEIILRQEGGRLAVQLVSGNPASLEILSLAMGDLRKKLRALDRDVSVEVLDRRGRGGGDGSGHGRGSDYSDGNEG
ncbi:MAG: hypothetical protein FWG97_01705 [Deltaproteobacteria bacterium]|nr:hypothetical protein [Deltaproteobacteria bacterium]